MRIQTKSLRPVLLLLCLSSWILLTTPSQAQIDTDQEPGQSPSAPTRHRSRRTQPATTTANPKKNDSRRISGKCTVLAGATNLATQPCPSAVLLLTDASGKELLRTRTTSHGDFEFVTEDPGPFQITPLSTLYKVSSPTGVTDKTKPVDLQLTEK